MILQRGSELLRERIRMSRPIASPQEHLKAALSWLYAAQDSSPDGGVSHSFLIGKRWMRSYPETTGYIIPTLLNWSRAKQDDEAERRAMDMADWELGVQLECGAIPELTSGKPVIFDTGQVIFGWMAAHRHSGDDRYLDAASRGADWLLSQLDAEGVWRSPHDSGGPGRVYNARVAWSLLELSRLAEDPSLEIPMRRFLDWALAQERGEGWFDHNCLTHDAEPLLHTIAYTARGFLESGMLLGEPKLLEASGRTATRLNGAVDARGRLPGRFDREWRAAVNWACLTGMAQTSIIWQRLAASADSHQAPKAEEYVRAARLVNSWLMRGQDISSGDPRLRGGIRGSYPVNGAYGQWRVLNWATKFFIDAIMADMPGNMVHYPG